MCCDSSGVFYFAFIQMTHKNCDETCVYQKSCCKELGLLTTVECENFIDSIKKINGLCVCDVQNTTHYQCF